MFDIYTPAKTQWYTPADRDPTSKLIRTCRWAFWAVAFVSVSLVLIQGTSLKQNRFALLEWTCFFIFNTGNFALSLVERRRRETKESESL